MSAEALSAVSQTSGRCRVRSDRKMCAFCGFSVEDAPGGSIKMLHCTGGVRLPRFGDVFRGMEGCGNL